MGIAQQVEPLTGLEMDQLCINTIRTPSIDVVQQAKSGDPVTPRALAPLVYTIWKRMISDDHAAVARCETDVQRDCGNHVSATRSQPYYLDVTPTPIRVTW